MRKVEVMCPFSFLSAVVLMRERTAIRLCASHTHTEILSGPSSGGFSIPHIFSKNMLKMRVIIFKKACLHLENANTDVQFCVQVFGT